MIDVPVLPNVTSAPTNASSYAGVAAPQTASQRADVAATRVVSSKDSAKSDLNQYSQDKALDVIKYKAKLVAGENPYLNDISFTVYSGGDNSIPANEYVIRFTDVATGVVTVQTAPQLISDSGELVNSSI